MGVNWDETGFIWRHLLDQDLYLATPDHLLLFSHRPWAPLPIFESGEGGLQVAAFPCHVCGFPVSAVRLCTRAGWQASSGHGP